MKKKPDKGVYTSQFTLEQYKIMPKMQLMEELYNLQKASNYKETLARQELIMKIISER